MPKNLKKRIVERDIEWVNILRKHTFYIQMASIIFDVIYIIYVAKNAFNNNT